MRQDFIGATLILVLQQQAFDVDGGLYLVRSLVKLSSVRTVVFVEWTTAQFADDAPRR